MKLGDLVQVRGGLYDWASPGIIIRIDREWMSEADDQSLTIHILGMTGEIHTWWDWQLEVISEAEMILPV